LRLAIFFRRDLTSNGEFLRNYNRNVAFYQLNYKSHEAFDRTRTGNIIIVVLTKLNYLAIARTGFEPMTHDVQLFLVIVKPPSRVEYKNGIQFFAPFYTIVLYRNTQQDSLDIFNILKIVFDKFHNTCDTYYLLTLQIFPTTAQSFCVVKFF
jgi:hypothetical protein